MKNKFISIALFFCITNIHAEVPNEAEIQVCQDQAENYGNGKSEDFIASRCLNTFKQLASKNAIVESTIKKRKYYGHKNMIIIEQFKDNLVSNEIIAGNSTELTSIVALAIDEKNNEIVVLEESGDIYFFTTTISGNIAPYRTLKNLELLGSKELIVDPITEQILVYNKKTDKVLFFSRLANIHAPKVRQNLDILKVIHIEKDEFNDQSLRKLIQRPAL